MIISKEIRTIIRNAAEQRDCKYRITSEGEVHFYGTMPNSNQTGWYFVGWTPEEAIRHLGCE